MFPRVQFLEKKAVVAGKIEDIWTKKGQSLILQEDSMCGRLEGERI